MPLHCLLGQSDLLFSFLLWQFYYALFLSMVILSFFLFFREDVVGVDTWVASSGKNGMRRDWHVHDHRTGQTVLRATRLVPIYALHLHSFYRRSHSVVGKFTSKHI